MKTSKSRLGYLLSCLLAFAFNIAIVSASVPSYTVPGQSTITGIPGILCFNSNGYLTLCNTTTSALMSQSEFQEGTSTPDHQPTISSTWTLLVGGSVISTLLPSQAPVASSISFTLTQTSPLATISLATSTMMVSKPPSSPTLAITNISGSSDSVSTSTMTLTSNKPPISSPPPVLSTSVVVVTSTAKSSSHKSFKIPKAFLVLTFIFMLLSAVSAWDTDTTTIRLQDTVTETLPCSVSTVASPITPPFLGIFPPSTLELVPTDHHVPIQYSPTLTASHASTLASRPGPYHSSLTQSSPKSSPTVTSASVKSFKTPNMLLIFTFLAMVLFVSAHDAATIVSSGDAVPRQSMSCSIDSSPACGEPVLGPPWVPSQPVLPTPSPTEPLIEVPDHNIPSHISSIASIASGFISSLTATAMPQPPTSMAVPTSTAKPSAAKSLSPPSIFRLLTIMGSFFSSVTAESVSASPLATVTPGDELPCLAGSPGCGISIPNSSTTLSAAGDSSTASFRIATPTSAQVPVRTPPGTPRGGAGTLKSREGLRELLGVGPVLGFFMAAI